VSITPLATEGEVAGGGLRPPQNDFRGGKPPPCFIFKKKQIFIFYLLIFLFYIYIIVIDTCQFLIECDVAY